MLKTMDPTDCYLIQFDALERAATRSPSAWLLPVRKAALARFSELGFPTIKDEEWRFTNVAPIAETPFESPPDDAARVTRDDVARFAPTDRHGPVLVFVNGRPAPELSSRSSLPNGVTIGGMGEALQSDDKVVRANLTEHVNLQDQAFVALNTALFEDGAWVHVPKGVVVESPIHILHISTASERAWVAHPRNLIVVDANAQATVVETYAGIGEGAYFNNPVTEIAAGEGAVVDHYKIERESPAAYHIATLQIHQSRNSNVSSHNVSFGGNLVRNDVNALMNGAGCECTLNGLSVLHGEQHVDNHLYVDHAKPHCDSREYYKAVLEDRSKGVFSGRIIVREGAQKTDAKQTNMTLLLSEQAEIESKPQLEIFADDVKCTHGATIGQLDKDALFYLQARGLDAATARGVLVYAFATESLNRIRVAPLREQVESLLLDRLPQGRALREEI